MCFIGAKSPFGNSKGSGGRGSDGCTAKNGHDITELDTEEFEGKFYVMGSLPNTNLLVEGLGAEAKTSLMLGKHPVAKLHTQALVYQFKNKQAKVPF